MTNDWKKIKRDACWPKVVNQFRYTSKDEIIRSVSSGAVTIGVEEPLDDVIRVALYVHSRGLSIIDAAEIVYSLRGYPKARSQLGNITPNRAIKVTRKLAEELALAFFDLMNGRVFQASHRIALARAQFCRIGERRYHELIGT